MTPVIVRLGGPLCVFHTLHYDELDSPDTSAQKHLCHMIWKLLGLMV